MKKILSLLILSLGALSCSNKQMMDGKNTNRLPVDTDYISKRDGVNVKQGVLYHRFNINDSMKNDTVYFYEYMKYLHKGERGTLITNQSFEPGQFVYDDKYNVLEIISKPIRITELKDK